MFVLEILLYVFVFEYTATGRICISVWPGEQHNKIISTKHLVTWTTTFYITTTVNITLTVYHYSCVKQQEVITYQHSPWSKCILLNKSQYRISLKPVFQDCKEGSWHSWSNVDNYWWSLFGGMYTLSLNTKGEYIRDAIY